MESKAQAWDLWMRDDLLDAVAVSMYGGDIRAPIQSAMAMLGGDARKLICAISAEQSTRVYLTNIQSARQPPSVRGKRLKMYYMTQFEERPPRFSIQVNEKGAVTRDYAFFIENRLRERYGLEGVPLIIDFRTSS